ncbi:MAG: CCA tRNA nucleotidyltransferase [Candidatus Parvarchaeum sp.]
MIIRSDVKQLLDSIAIIPGGRAYLVGGFVRDSLLGLPSHDYDIVTNIGINELKRHLDSHGYVAINTNDFGTLAVILNGQKIDIAQFRADTYDMVGRKPSIQPVSTIEEDLNRRDFSINSMAYEYPSMKLIDPFKGAEDLKRKILRSIRNPNLVFMEDPLRMMRAARFAAKYSLTVSPDLSEAMLAKKYELRRISAERIREELFKGFSLSPSERGQYAANLIDFHLLEIIIPEFSQINNIRHDSRGHHYDELLAQHMVDSVSHYRGQDALVAITIFLHDIGKIQAYKQVDGKAMFLDHDTIGAQILAGRLPQLKFTRQETGFIVNAVKNHLFFSQLKQSTPSNQYKKLAKMFIEQNENIDFLIKLAEIGQADQAADYTEYVRILRSFTSMPKIVTGNDVLALPPLYRAKALRKARYYQLIHQGETSEQLLHLVRNDFREGIL